MSKLSKFSIDGWDFYQYAYSVKWHKERFGDPETIEAARKAYEVENKTPPPTIEQFYDFELTTKLVKTMLGDILGQRSFDIKLTSDQEPKNGN